MNFEQRKELCHYRQERAVKTLNSARILFEQNDLEGTTNRIYYSIFYASGALALAYSFSTTKHTGLLNWFQKDMVKTGKVELHYSDIYRQAFNLRTKGDYADMVKLNQEEIISLLHSAELFISRIRRLTDEKLEELEKFLSGR